MTSQNSGQDGRHDSMMAAMAPIQDGVQAQLRVVTSDARPREGSVTS